MNQICLGTTNLLREGGVYLLPLEQFNAEWYVTGDMDVLFEVDDKGNVWSHSAFEAFNQYDGQAAGHLISELRTLSSNDDFLLSNSLFGNMLVGRVLADINVTAKSNLFPHEYGAYFNYAFTVNELLSVPDTCNYKQPGPSGNIMIYDYQDAEMNLEPGKRYLIYLDYSDEDRVVYADAGMIAEIQAGETISAISAPDSSSIPGDSVFTPYDGYAVAEIKGLISRINLWEESRSN